MQEILTYIVLIAAVVYIIKRIFFNQKSDKGCGGTDCGC